MSVPRNWRLQPQRYRLVGEVCDKCGVAIFPPRDVCPECEAPAKTPFTFSGVGEVYSYSTIYHPPAGFEESVPYTVALVRLADAAPGELTLVALGPLTNVALACRLDPDFPRKIGRFVFMGGTIAAKGNTAPHITAEFNIHCDPEAALIVLEAFPLATMLSWETTLHHPLSWSQYDALIAQDTAAARFVADTTRETVAFLRQHPRVPGYLLPDPLAMAIALEPDLIHAHEQHYVAVEVQGRQTRGQTVVDYFGLLGRTPNVDVVTDVNVAGVYELFRRAVS